MEVLKKLFFFYFILIKLVQLEKSYLFHVRRIQYFIGEVRMIGRDQLIVKVRLVSLTIRRKTLLEVLLYLEPDWVLR